MIVSSGNYPPYSPDLNLLNMPGQRLKDTTYKLDRDRVSIRGSSEEVRKRFMELLEQVWEVLVNNYFDRLICSTDSCVNVVLEAKRRDTRY